MDPEERQFRNREYAEESAHALQLLLEIVDRGGHLTIIKGKCNLGDDQSPLPAVTLDADVIGAMDGQLATPVTLSISVAEKLIQHSAEDVLMEAFVKLIHELHERVVGG